MQQAESKDDSNRPHRSLTAQSRSDPEIRVTFSGAVTEDVTNITDRYVPSWTFLVTEERDTVLTTRSVTARNPHSEKTVLTQLCRDNSARQSVITMDVAPELGLAPGGHCSQSHGTSDSLQPAPKKRPLRDLVLQLLSGTFGTITLTGAEGLPSLQFVDVINRPGSMVPRSKVPVDAHSYCAKMGILVGGNPWHCIEPLQTRVPFAKTTVCSSTLGNFFMEADDVYKPPLPPVTVAALVPNADNVHLPTANRHAVKHSWFSLEQACTAEKGRYKSGCPRFANLTPLPDIPSLLIVPAFVGDLSKKIRKLEGINPRHFCCKER